MIVRDISKATKEYFSHSNIRTLPRRGMLASRNPIRRSQSSTMPQIPAWNRSPAPVVPVFPQNPRSFAEQTRRSNSNTTSSTNSQPTQSKQTKSKKQANQGAHHSQPYTFWLATWPYQRSRVSSPSNIPSPRASQLRVLSQTTHYLSNLVASHGSRVHKASTADTVTLTTYRRHAHVKAIHTRSVSYFSISYSILYPTPHASRAEMSPDRPCIRYSASTSVTSSHIYNQPAHRRPPECKFRRHSVHSDIA
jgi:hypothetical protein